MTTDTTTDPELGRLLDAYNDSAIAYGQARRTGDYRQERAMDAARTALLSYLEVAYVRRGSYTAARGVLPRRPGDELPEDAIRRVRDGG